MYVEDYASFDTALSCTSFKAMIAKYKRINGVEPKELHVHTDLESRAREVLRHSGAPRYWKVIVKEDSREEGWSLLGEKKLYE